VIAFPPKKEKTKNLTKPTVKTEKEASAAVRLPLLTRGRRTKAGAKAKAVERGADNRERITKAASPRFCGGRRQRRRAEEQSEDAGGWTKRARAKRAMCA